MQPSTEKEPAPAYKPDDVAYREALRRLELDRESLKTKAEKENNETVSISPTKPSDYE